MLKKLAIAAAIVGASTVASADVYLNTQSLNAVQVADNLNAVLFNGPVVQGAVNVANTASIVDNDAFGGDIYTSTQTLNAGQDARNRSLTGLAVSIDQDALNFANDLTISDAGGFPFFATQTVTNTQTSNAVQRARNFNATVATGSVDQLAQNSVNTADITLPATPSFNTVNSNQQVNAAQIARNVNVAVAAGSTTQNAVNIANSLSVTQ